MQKLSPDIISLVLSELKYEDVVNWAYSTENIRRVCASDRFNRLWQDKLINDFGEHFTEHLDTDDRNAFNFYAKLVRIFSTFRAELKDGDPTPFDIFKSFVQGAEDDNFNRIIKSPIIVITGEWDSGKTLLSRLLAKTVDDPARYRYDSLFHNNGITAILQRTEDNLLFINGDMDNLDVIKMKNLVNYSREGAFAYSSTGGIIDYKPPRKIIIISDREYKLPPNLEKYIYILKLATIPPLERDPTALEFI